MNNLVTGPIELTLDESDAIGAVYQTAFAGDPWYEVSKCPAPEPAEQCPGGFSALKVGEFCTRCALSPQQEAYPLAELRETFARSLGDRSAQLYREYSPDGKLLTAAIFWEDTPANIGARKYAKVEAMQRWLKASLSDEPVLWLDEIFADRDVRPLGNLGNFKTMCEQALANSGSSLLAFRTINKALLSKSKSCFEDNCFILEPGQVPDRRYFVMIGKERADE